MTSIMDQRSGEPRRDDDDNGNGRFKLTADKIITWVIAALIAYGMVTSRIAVLESKQMGVEQRLDRMENKLDQLLQRP